MLKVVNVTTGAIVASYAMETPRDEPENETPLGLETRTRLNQKIAARNEDRHADAERIADVLNGHADSSVCYVVLNTGAGDFFGDVAEGCRA